MKQQFSILTIAIIIFGAVAFSSFQNGKENKGKGNKEQADKQDKGQGNNKDKGNKDGDKGNGKGNDQKDKNNDKSNNNGNDKDKGRGNDNDNNNNDKDNGKGKYKMKDGFKWDNETFRDRDKYYKNQEKVSICHKANRNNEPAVTIRVSENALKAHMNHGDVMGECTNVNNGTFSDIFIKRRTDYYTTLQDSYEQVSYSRSILDYAMERLTGTRTQLVTLQNNNAPVADIERKRVLVVDLEQNVSLLERLVGVTANLVANKLMN